MKRVIVFIMIFCGCSVLSGLKQSQAKIKLNTRLYNAVLQENYKRVKELLSSGANPHQRFKGVPLNELTQNEDIIQLLSLYKRVHKNGIVANED